MKLVQVSSSCLHCSGWHNHRCFRTAWRA